MAGRWSAETAGMMAASGSRHSGAQGVRSAAWTAASSFASRLALAARLDRRAVRTRHTRRTWPGPPLAAHSPSQAAAGTPSSPAAPNQTYSTS